MRMGHLSLQPTGGLGKRRKLPQLVRKQVLLRFELEKRS